jgi:1,2-diacylglycerol 3-alpha-glucosyltransferase
VIPNGMELKAFYSPARPLTKRDLGLPESAILCIYVGRLAPEKSLDALLAQFALARRQAPELRLLLVGGGQQQRRLELEAWRLGISDFVHFAGMVPPEAVPNYLAAADLFATASVSEVHPLTVIEAMAAGLPVVGRAAPGLVDLVESGVSGLLSEGDEQSLARALADLARERARRLRLGQAAQDASRRFDIRNNVAQVVDLYERLR